MSKFSEILSHARRAAGLGQAELAEAIGVSTATIASWETGRRRPSWGARPKIIEAADRVRVAASDLSTMLIDVGLDPVPPGRLAPLLDRRRGLDAIRAECRSYPWPTLAMNEDFEVVAWNEAANDLSELDFGTDLAEPGARHLLRMALSRHYADKLQNWDRVISIMVGMWKTTGFDPLSPDTRTPYFENLMNFVLTHHGTELGRLLTLWNNAPAHTEGQRVCFVSEWLTSEQARLRFNCQLTAWSDFDAVAAFDWHPADASTWDWLIARRKARFWSASPRDDSSWSAQVTSARHLLRLERERNGLTQGELAIRAGVSEDLVFSLEAGRKPLTERTLVRLGKVMALAAIDLNALLSAAGFAPRASEQYAYILGYELPESTRYGDTLERRMNWTPGQVSRELATYSWPVVVVNQRCEVVTTNAPANRLLQRSLQDLGQGPARNLFALVTDAPFRQAAANWETVVANVLPGNLEAYIAPPGIDPGAMKDEAYFAAVVELVRRREHLAGRGDDAIRRTFEAWRSKPERRMSSRIAFPFEWRDGNRLLHFDAVITPWNAMRDPYWSIELHPGDADTWDWWS